jgi:LuxR family glucitol operon transcriptional activator
LNKESQIDEFFEEFSFLNLKDVLIAFNNFKLARPFLGELSKDKFVELMDNLNRYRKKIAHAKSTFSELDLLTLIDEVRMLCQGKNAEDVIQYLRNEAYKNAREIPLDFFEEYEISNTLDGGFVGRAKEIRAIRNFIKSDQDRVITITGAGGVGKTAIALKVAYSFLSDQYNPFSAITWFSAKTSKLTDEGIVPLTPGIKSYEKLILDLLDILDPDILEKFMDAKVPIESCATHLRNIFSSNKILLVVDNLETIIKDDTLIKFIEEIPCPSQVLITSRKGLGEFERRYPLTDMQEKDAVLLFRIISKERNRNDLLRLKEETVLELVKRVRCYPLLIKWAIGQVCLGKEINKAFSQIFSGESDIAKFAFNDVFSLLTEDAKNVLYSIIVYGDKPVSRYVLMHLSNMGDDQFEEAIRELTMTSFVFPESRESPSGTITEYSMLELTRGFVETKLDEDEKTRAMLFTRLHHLKEQIQEFERSKSSYFQSLVSLGIKTPEEQVAFNYVKAAKNFYFRGDTQNAEKNFELALKIAPQLSYVLTEFSKFEFARRHVREGLKLAEKAVTVAPQNYHAWFNYGIMLEKVSDFPNAIKCLEKAKELNPKHLPIFTELGRAHSFAGNYERAETELTNALKEEKYPNYRHMIITFQSIAENYRRWAQSFRNRRDVEGELKMLDKAMDSIYKAFEIAPKNRKIQRIYHKICIELAITHSKREGFASAKPYLERCVQPTQLGNNQIFPDSVTLPSAYFYLAALGMHEKNQDKEEIKNWINQGLATCRNIKLEKKLEDLKRQFGGKLDNRAYGKIKFFHTLRKFGIIESVNKEYLFVLSDFRERQNRESLYALEGKAVSFKLIESPKDKNKLVAVDIIFESTP